MSDQIEIEWRTDGFQWRKFSGKWRRTCCYENCIRFAKAGGGKGGGQPSCTQHKKFMDIIHPTKIIKEGEYEIEYRSYGKYRLAGQTMARVCNYEKCVNLSQDKTYFCIKHKEGEKYVETEYEEKQIILINQKKRDNCRENSKKGTITELCVIDYLCEIDNVVSVRHLGGTSDKIDIKYLLAEEKEWRGVQVKTLSPGINADCWTATWSKKTYEPDTLMVLINLEETRFGLIYFKNCPIGSIALSFANEGRSKNNFSKYKDNMFTDSVTFSVKLEEMIKLSTLYTDTRSHSNIMEDEHLKRLKTVCDEEKLVFVDKRIDGGVIDCTINGHRIQNKCSNFIHKKQQGKQYLFNITKCHYSSNGIQRSQPYHADDPIDFFIFEIKPYHNQFYIIPRKVMYEKGYLRDTKQKGKWRIGIYPPEYERTAKFWMKDYLNRWDFFLT